MKPRLLDLFCGAGGAGMGYHRAGFDVVGVDIKQQGHYPFEFHQADALEYVAQHGHEFDAIHASPPCQADSVTRNMPWTRGHKGEIPRLIKPVRELLQDTGLPYVIENVVGADLICPITLCGTMFGIKVFRHRIFESSCLMLQPPHIPHTGLQVGRDGFVCVAGHGDSGRGRIPADHRNKASWQLGMGIDWMTMGEMAEAIPPAYTEFIGRQLIRAIRQEAA